VRTPRVKLPNGSVRLVEPDFAGRLYGFTLLFEAFILMLARQMPFAAVARIVGESPRPGTGGVSEVCGNGLWSG
jgi:transposase